MDLNTLNELELNLTYVMRSELPVITKWVKNAGPFVSIRRRPHGRRTIGVSIATIKFNHPQFEENVIKIKECRAFCKESAIF